MKEYTESEENKMDINESTCINNINKNILPLVICVGCLAVIVLKRNVRSLNGRVDDIAQSIEEQACNISF